MGSYPNIADVNFLGRKAAEGEVISPKKNSAKLPNQVIDGFVRASQSATKRTAEAAKVPAAARGLHRRGQKAHTLMRGALKNPATGFNSRIEHLKQGPNPQRELRAKQTAKHSKINRFGGYASTVYLGKSKTVVTASVTPRRAKPADQAKAEPQTVMPSMVTSASHHRLERMLDAALLKATSHKSAMEYEAARHFWQKPRWLGRHRGIKLSLLGVLLLGVMAFITWHEVPQFSVKLAGARAGLAATTPAYTPSGYKLVAPAAAANKIVTLQYASSNDSSKIYTVNEQRSNQDSTSLIAENTDPSQQVQTAQANGVPIVMVQNKIMCVSNGLKTTVINKSDLSPDELLSIAKGVCG